MIKEKTEKGLSQNNQYNFDKMHKLIGVILIVCGISIFILFSMLIVVTKTEYFTTKYASGKVEYSSKVSQTLIEWLISDKHYCLAFPIFLPIFFLILYFRWTAFAYFKHS